MRYISSKLFLLLLIFCVDVGAQVNPVSNIRWPVATGTVDPVTPTQACTTLNYGQPYTNTATGKLFVCAASGWVIVGPTIGAVFPGTSKIVVNTSTTASRNAVLTDLTTFWTASGTGCGVSTNVPQLNGNCIAPTGGGIPPVVSGSSQYANNGTTAFLSGKQYNEEAFNTSNNGVATAQGLGLTNILVPNGSTTTEDVFGAVTVNGTHLHDERQGYVLDQYLNSQPGFNASNSSYTWCTDNRAAATSTTEDHGGCKQTVAVYSESGIDATGTPTLYKAEDLQANFFGNGIHQGRSSFVNCYTDDDCGLDYGYLHVRAACLAGASECSLMHNRQGVEDPTVSGTITSGGSGSMAVQTNLTGGGLANSANIIFPSENVSSGIITAFTPGPGPGDRTLGFVTTSDTHSISTGYGFITAACGVATVADSPLPATCPFTTGTVAGHTGFGSFSTGLVAVADWVDFECAAATSVGGGNITLNLTKHHPINTPIYQGAGSCAKLMQGRGASPVWTSTDGFTPNLPVAGARTTTTWDVVLPVKNAQNGQTPIPIYGPISTSITSASQTGTTVTLTVASGVYFNHYVAPSGASICVSGVSTSAFNQCGITSIVASNSGTTLTYTVGSSASISGTGGVINVGTISSPASNGLGNYEVDCGTLVTKIGGVTYPNRPMGDGSLHLQANNCTMATSETFIQPNNMAQFFTAARFGWNAHTPNPGFGSNVLTELGWDGLAGSGSTYFKTITSDLASAYKKYGGNYDPRTFLAATDQGIGTLINMPTAPIGNISSGQVGGDVITVGVFPTFPGTSTPVGFETQYNLFDLVMNTGSLFMRADVTDNSLSLIGQAVAPTFKVFGNVLVGTSVGDGVSLLQVNGVAKVNTLLPGVLYNAAGTALPTCAVGVKGEQAVVSDATSPTYMGAYTSGGLVTTAVICSFNGTTYSWLTH